MPKWAAVVPCNRPERVQPFLDAWRPLFEKHNVTLFIVFDLPTIPPFKAYGQHWAFCHDAIPEFIPRGTDMIRSYGFYRAWVDGADFTLSLDDDVRPSCRITDLDPFVEYERVFEAGAPLSDYFDVGALTTFDGQMRGFPFADRERRPVGLQAGGWHNVLDYDAVTQLSRAPHKHYFKQAVVPVPRGAAVTVCAMNMAFQTELTPIMWQLPLVDGKYNRFGDIWSGLFAKRVLDAIGEAVVVNGKAVVWHDRASDPFANIVREAPGLELNERLWRKSRVAPGEGISALGAYRLVTAQAALTFDYEYANAFMEARNQWLDLFA